MLKDNLPLQTSWPLWKKLLFRFFFIYVGLQIAPWTWLDAVPGVNYATKYYYNLMDWAVEIANAKLFHVREVLVYPNGSGDTSYNWAQTWLFLCLALIGCIVWSLIDRKRAHYRQLNYWFCLFTRYYIALIALSYGILKIFALQMPFPSLSQLATPLGDLLPMRLSWMFIGYSSPYQVFSGIMEVIAGLLLLYRRTASFGVLVATVVFINVMVLNLCYDIPVKLFSMHIVLFCLVLLMNEWNRIACFMFLNKPAGCCELYHFSYNKRSMKLGRWIFKLGFIILFAGMPVYDNYKYYLEVQGRKEPGPIKAGVYEVTVYRLNNDTIPPIINDTMRWRDMIFEKWSQGSIQTADNIFTHRYGRAYFSYSIDSATKTIFMKNTRDTILQLRYNLPSENKIQLWGSKQKDSLYVELVKTDRHFQLAERQFHWLSEYNR